MITTDGPLATGAERVRIFSIAYELIPQIEGHDPTNEATNIVRQWWASKADKERLDWKEQAIGQGAYEFVLQEITREGLDLTTEIRVCPGANPAAAFFAIEMSARNSVPPFGRPKFLSDLVSRMGLRRADDSFTTTVTQATSYEEGRSFAERLMDPARSVPVVAINTSRYLAVPGEDWPQRLAEKLSGMANVVNIGKEATFGLTESEAVGERLSCFDGGVRLYFPINDIGTEPLSHPLFLRTKLVRWSEFSADKGFPRLLFALTQLLARYYAEHPRVPEQLRRVQWVERKYRALLHAASFGKEEMQQRTEQLEAQVRELRQYVEEFERENTKLEVESRRLRERCEQLEKDKVVLEQRLSDPPSTVTDQTDNAEDAPPKTHAEAIARAKSQFPDTLDLSDLEDPENFDPEEVLTVLQCMNAVCGRQRGGGLKGAAGNVLVQELYKEGIGGRYEPGPTSLYGRLPSGDRVECRHRIHVKSGAWARTQSIYWAEDSSASVVRYLVRRIGRHYPP